MPRKQMDPLIAVVEFFETASTEAIQTALTVVTHIVKRRTATKAKPVQTRAATPPVNEAAPITAPKIRKPRGGAAALPGPVSQVGEQA